MATAVAKKKGRPALGTTSIMLTMGKPKKANNDWTVVLADVPIYIPITASMIARAIPGSPRYCVVALGLKALFGREYDFQVGKVYTKIWDRVKKIEVRFHTPAALSRRLSRFDKKRGWDLPPNVYRLNPMPAAVRNGLANRKNILDYHFNKKRRAAKAKGGTTVFVKGGKKKTARRAPYSRTVLRNTRISWTPPKL